VTCRRARAGVQGVRLRLGVYLSPWDRNHAEYGRPAYLELLPQPAPRAPDGLGPIFEVWFDGANGGDGYYGGGARDRRIDRATYYDWATPGRWSSVAARRRHVQRRRPPMCAGSATRRRCRVRTSWGAMSRGNMFPGQPGLPEDRRGKTRRQQIGCRPRSMCRSGRMVLPPGQRTVRSSPSTGLLDIHEQSIGRGANLLLNIHPTDAAHPRHRCGGCSASSAAGSRPSTRPTWRARRPPVRQRAGASSSIRRDARQRRRRLHVLGDRRWGNQRRGRSRVASPRDP